MPPQAQPAKPRARAPFHVMVKPIGPRCNLACEYCFYLEKEKLYERGERYRMSDETLRKYVRDYIESSPGDEIVFAWQGGEPTLMGVDFFRRVVAYQKEFGDGRRIENALQTNGTLLDAEWGQFLGEHHFLIGLSIDGPRQLHDTYRVDRGNGPTFDKVMRGLEVLKKHQVEFNTLTCVNRRNALKPLEVYRFLRGIGARFMQFIPIVERRPDAQANELGLDLAAPPKLTKGTPEEEADNPGMMPWSVKAKDYGEFLVQIFDRWVHHDVGRYHVQLFDVSLGAWLGMPGGLCIYGETCGRAIILEHDGSYYACDHFVYPDFKIGHVDEGSLAEIVDSPKQTKFGNDKRDTLPSICQKCEVRFACNGACPKHRFNVTPEGEPGWNYLCAGYKRFFTHADPYFRVMAELYRRQQAPAAIIDLLKRKAIPGLN